MHWYTWALTLWAIVSGVPALAVLLFLLPTVVAGRIGETMRTRATASSTAPAATPSALTREAQMRRPSERVHPGRATSRPADRDSAASPPAG